MSFYLHAQETNFNLKTSAIISICLKARKGCSNLSLWPPVQYTLEDGSQKLCHPSHRGGGMKSDPLPYSGYPRSKQAMTGKWEASMCLFFNICDMKSFIQTNLWNSHISFSQTFSFHPNLPTMKNDAVIRGMLNYFPAIKFYEPNFYPSLCIFLFIFIYP